ncbi:MAG: leucine-rich repeat domain-containing protein [Bacteroidia bacterium]|nr:leucine-rich repeat domain-containing protein [Bacteroidia bacterium]MDW8332760.1 leucine-rich repeat domain-containing protein [Bacteroidia bacterium]
MVRTMMFLCVGCAYAQICCAQILSDKELERVRWHYRVEDGYDNPDAVYKLDLSGKRLSKFPVEIFVFKNLHVLNLADNKIDSLPADIDRLQSLVSLNLNNNRINRLPDNLGNLRHLRHLYLARNLLHRFPLGMHGLKNLKYLDVSYNFITTYELDWIAKVLPQCTLKF